MSQTGEVRSVWNIIPTEDEMSICNKKTQMLLGEWIRVW